MCVTYNLLSHVHYFIHINYIFIILVGCIFVMNLSYSPADFKHCLTDECTKVLPSTFQVHLAEESSSKKVKKELFLLSNVTDFDQQTTNLGNRKCNFASFITQCELGIRIETVRVESLSQLCIDQLHCQQYIQVL